MYSALNNQKRGYVNLQNIHQQNQNTPHLARLGLIAPSIINKSLLSKHTDGEAQQVHGNAMCLVLLGQTPTQSYNL